jgi:hypothetical protein
MGRSSCIWPGEMSSPEIQRSFVHTMLIVSSLLLVPAAGCSKKSRLNVYPVHGQVTYQGHGVPRATVIFIPTGDTAETVKKLRPFAYADDQGNFAIKTYVDDDGAPAGKYRVCIVASSAGSSGRGKDHPAESTPSSATAVAIPIVVLKRFGNAETSGIEVTVREGENKLEPFELSAGAKS